MSALEDSLRKVYKLTGGDPGFEVSPPPMTTEQQRMAKIQMYAAKYKLKCCDITMQHKSKDKYRQNKNLGIVHARHLLKTHQDFFENHKKKDDLADCFLQAMSYIKFFLK